MIVGVIIDFLVAAVIITIGLVLWIKKKISLVHSYHHTHVKEEDVPAYTRALGIGLIVIGLGIAGTGVLDLLHIGLWWIPLLVGFVVGLAILCVAQKKYNGSIFG